MKRAHHPPLRSLALWLLLCLCGGVWLTGQLVEEIDPQKLWALVVGISNYAHAEPLLYASTDAQSVADFLKSPRGGAVPEDHLFTLLEGMASRYELLVQIEALQEIVQNGDTIYIYIAGHGHINRRGIGYFIPSDGDLRIPAATAVPFSSIKELIDLGLAHAKNRILITDICHSGRIGPEKTQLASKIQNLINAELMKLGERPGGTFLNLLASQPTEPSWESDELGHGIFTYSLLEALNGKAAPTDAKLVHADAVVDFVRNEVPRWTGNQQNPVANDSFDPTLTLSYLDRPGPILEVQQDDTILLLEHTDESPFIRAQWVDPRNESIAVRQIPKDREAVPIGALAPGPLQLSLFDHENNEHAVELNLEKGENRLDIRSAQLGRNRFQPGRMVQTASLSPSPAPAAPVFQQPTAAPDPEPEATLLLQLPSQTLLFLDGEFFGNGQGQNRLVALHGLEPGPKVLRLVHSPTYEQRFRVELFEGRQIFDPASGELLAVTEIEAPPELLAPPQNLPSGLDDLYRRFRQALWEGRLIAPAGDSAWDYFQQMDGRLPGPLRLQTRNELVVAMGNRAQQTVLKYVRGGDVRWRAEVFEEGSELIDRIQRIFQSSDFYESQERFFRGRALIERGNFQQALAELNQSIALDSEASHSHNAQGLAYWQQGLLNQALPPLDRAIQLSPNWTYPRITRSLILLEQRRYAEAQQGLEEAVALDPEDSTAHHALGQVSFLSGRWREAERQVRQAIELNPGNAYAYHTLGILQRRLQRFDEAERSLRLAIRLEPEENTFRLSLAELFRQLGRVGEAQNIFASLRADHPDDVEILKAYAEFLGVLRRRDEAAAAFAKAINLEPRNANLRVSHGIFLVESQQADLAEREFRRALDIDPANAYAHYRLAELLFAARELSDAERQAQEAVKADPRYAPPFRLLGQLRFARRRHDEALGYFRQARDFSIEPSQKQELQEIIDRVESIIVDEELERAEEKISNRKYADAWRIYTETLKRAPDSKKLRNRILEFMERHESESDAADLPPAPWTAALSTSFWRSQAEAEKLWAEGRREEAFKRFRAGLENLEGEDLEKVTATAFNFQNEERGVHGIVHRWGLRLLAQGRFQEAKDLMRTAIDKWIFGVVPNYRPLTVDSLMTPDDAERPSRFGDFEVAHHADERAHGILAAAAAGLGQMEELQRYLEALDAHGVNLRVRLSVAEALERSQRPNEALQLLSAAVSEADDTPGLAEAFVLLAEIHCRTGDCEAARDVLKAGLNRLPGSPKIEDALRKLP